MKFTSEDLMKAMGLQVGDTIILNGKTHTFKTDKSGKLLYKNVLKMLIDVDFDILPRLKRVGDLKCDDFECTDCPLQYICCLCDWSFKTNNNLFNILELFNCNDQEIHDLLKARLDKELKEYE